MSRPSLRTALWIFAVVAVLGVHAAPGWSALPPDEELIAKVDALAAAALREPGAAGLSVAVAVGDRVVMEKGYGKAEVEHGVPATAETLFRIGSVTKQYTAAAVMRLVEQGKLSLDDPIQKHLPEYPATAQTVTIRQLLNHTSGIWSYTEDEGFMTREASLELGPEELIARFKDVPLEFEPGSRFNYSNSAYYLLGPVIEKASGKPYARFLQDEFFGPLGLGKTRYESNREIIPGRAQGYGLVDGQLANDRPIGADVPGAAGSLLASAGDLVRWQIALAGGKVVSEASYGQMTTGATLKDGKQTGYGFGLATAELEGKRVVEHGGGIFGFNSMLSYFPEEKLSVAVISNSETVSAGRLAQGIARAALGIRVEEAKDLDVTAAEIARYVGQFKFESIPLEIRFFEKGGRLYAQATGQPEIALLSQGGGVFRASFDETMRIVFPAGEGAAAGMTLHQRGREMVAKRVE